MMPLVLRWVPILTFGRLDLVVVVDRFSHKVLAWRDNVFVERLWRTIQYEKVYLRAYRSVSEARCGLVRYLAFYNRRRPHSSLGGQTPDQAYFNQPTPIPAAA